MSKCNWSDPKLSYDDLVETLSDYHKEVHGFRLRMCMDDESNRAEVIAELEKLDAYMERSMATAEGRAMLRREGWHVVEPEAA